MKVTNVKGKDYLCIKNKIKVVRMSFLPQSTGRRFDTWAYSLVLYNRISDLVVNTSIVH